jgi:outer membrane immunogenic protein
MCASSAQATDIYSVPAIGWAGFYVGGDVGAGISDETDDSFFAGGFHAGYNWQTNNVVLGLENSITFIDAPDIDYVATLRARLGYAAGNSLVYGTGGLAFASLPEDLASIIDIDDTAWGWAAGGGYEFKRDSGWSVGAEALYYNFDIDGEDADAWTVMGRISYHLGGRNDGYK